MLSPANQTHFSLTIDGFEHDFQVLAFTGEESISKPYFFNVELVGQRPDVDLQRLFDAQAFLAFDAQGNGIHGRIYHIVPVRNAQGLTHYNLALVPHLSYLRHRINQRIYQRFSVPTIVALILEEHGMLGDAYRFELGSTYPERDYCTQYDETDLHFVQRLCEEEGIHFHFQHSAQGHVLVFGDDRAAYRNRFPALALDPCAQPPRVHQKPRAPATRRRWSSRWTTRRARVIGASKGSRSSFPGIAKVALTTRAAAGWGARPIGVVNGRPCAPAWRSGSPFLKTTPINR